MHFKKCADCGGENRVGEVGGQTEGQEVRLEGGKTSLRLRKSG